MTRSAQVYFKELDATRFFGFLHVFLAHCFFTSNVQIQNSAPFYYVSHYLKAGFLGLDYFFVLSSFLLTYLALDERRCTGKFSPLKFLMRRGLRLWPLYYFIVIVVFGAVYLTNIHNQINQPPSIFNYLFFVQNYWMVKNGQDFLFILVFLWSIAIEEQFYIFWAAMQRFLSDYTITVSIILIVVSVLFRFFYFDSENHLLFHTISAVGNFGLGAIAGCLAFKNHAIIKFIQQINKSIIVFIYLLFIFFTVFYFQLFTTRIPVSLEKLIFGLLFCFIILEQSYAKNSILKLGGNKVINYLGQLSLGLYVYHGLVLTLFAYFTKNNGTSQDYLQVFLFQPFLIFGITVLIAVMSYELIEKRIYRLRRFFYSY
jgi:peptidoglycan/LPS O-acetylase OafA/YrhL